MTRRSDNVVVQDPRAVRLELIRRRHRELILQPREMLVSLEEDLAGPFAELDESDEMMLVGASEADRF